MNRKIKLPLADGFSALCGHVAQVRRTAEDSGSAVSSLAQAMAESMAEIEGVLRTKADAGRGAIVTIPKDGWNSDGAALYPHYIDITVSGLTARDRVDAEIAPSGSATAAACGMCPATETLAGAFRLRAVKPPETEIVAQYWITREKGD